MKPIEMQTVHGPGRHEKLIKFRQARVPGDLGGEYIINKGSRGPRVGTIEPGRYEIFFRMPGTRTEVVFKGYAMSPNHALARVTTAGNRSERVQRAA